jgi:hypothetical protein
MIFALQGILSDLYFNHPRLQRKKATGLEPPCHSGEPEPGLF